MNNLSFSEFNDEPEDRGTYKRTTLSTQHPDSKRGTLVNAKDARRTDRLCINCPIRVLGTDAAGQDFEDKARTLSICRYGATIVLDRQPAPGQRTTIRNLTTRQETIVQVVGQIVG